MIRLDEIDELIEFKGVLEKIPLHIHPDTHLVYWDANGEPRWKACRDESGAWGIEEK